MVQVRSPGEGLSVVVVVVVGAAAALVVVVVVLVIVVVAHYQNWQLIRYRPTCRSLRLLDLPCFYAWAPSQTNLMTGPILPATAGLSVRRKQNIGSLLLSWMMT